MTVERKPVSRRAILVGTMAATPLITSPLEAFAAGTLPQASAKYQDKPKGANRCETCVYYIASAKTAAPGQCKIVAGLVSPNGWCVLFAGKS